MTSGIQTVSVSHLGGSTIGYKFGRSYNPDLPTLVLSNSWSTSAELYRPQFADTDLNETANILAIEPFGHGTTRATYSDFTYWDSAIANLQVLDALNIPDAFVLGTSQGGWVAPRMALLAPPRIKGIIPLGTSMDYESQRTRDLGCWDGIGFCTPAIDALAESVADDWMIPTDMVDAVLHEGFGDTVSDDERSFWHATHQHNYSGDDGRQRLRTIAINLRDRDGLHGRLDRVKCPVLWMQGTADPVYSVRNAQEEIRMFTNSADAQLRVIDGGQHFLSVSHAEDVNTAVIDFVNARK